MCLYIPPRWYYLMNIPDGYSSFLAHWRLNLTMHAETVILTVTDPVPMVCILC